MILIDNFFISYNNILEKNYFINIQNIIVSYPLIWHNFMENILKKEIVKITDELHLIAFKEKMDSRNKRIYNFLLEKINTNYAISQFINNQNFDFLTFLTSKMTIIFSDYDYWLYLITLKALKELKIKVEEKSYFSYLNNCYIFFLATTINDIDYNICFNDTSYIYNIEEYFLNNSNILIIVSTKNISFNYIKVIKYHHNYYQFREELLDFLMFSL